MKARVDSLELKNAINIVLKFTSKSTLGVTDAILLYTGENEIWLRSTTFLSNARVRVNAWDVEPGNAVVQARNLAAVVFDSGDIQLRKTKANLILDYPDTSVRTKLIEADGSDFPTWKEAEEIFYLPSNILKVACNHTEKEDVSGRGPVVACIHITTVNEELVVFAADTTVGVMSELEANVEIDHVAIDGNLLLSVLSSLDDIIKIGISEKTIAILSMEDNIQFSFSRSRVSNSFLGIIDQMFTQDTSGDLKLEYQNVIEILKRCRAANLVDPSAQMSMRTNGNKLEIVMVGDGVEIKYGFPVEGNMDLAYFYVKTFMKTMGTMRECEEIKVSTRSDNGAVRWVQADGLDRHIIFCAAPTLFHD